MNSKHEKESAQVAKRCCEHFDAFHSNWLVILRVYLLACFVAIYGLKSRLDSSYCAQNSTIYRYDYNRRKHCRYFIPCQLFVGPVVMMMAFPHSPILTTSGLVRKTTQCSTRGSMQRKYTECARVLLCTRRVYIYVYYALPRSDSFGGSYHVCTF